MTNHGNSDSDAGPGGVRETLNEKPLLVGGAVFGLAIIVFLWQFWPESRPMAYYSADDGKTFFEAPIQAPPITHKGKEAVRAMVFSCGGGEPFVGYLMRFTPEGKAVADKLMNDPNWKGGPLGGQEVKRPGSPAWIAAGGAKAAPSQAAMAKAVKTYEEVISVRCPDGSANALMVEPD